MVVFLELCKSISEKFTDDVSEWVGGLPGSLLVSINALISSFLFEILFFEMINETLC